MKLGLREANQRFSEAVRAVRAGQDVVLTDRGRPVAAIVPLRDTDTEQSALQALAGEGLIIPPPRKGPMPPPRWRPVPVRGAPVSRTIIDDRDEHA